MRPPLRSTRSFPTYTFDLESVSGDGDTGSSSASLCAGSMAPRTGEAPTYPFRSSRAISSRPFFVSAYSDSTSPESSIESKKPRHRMTDSQTAALEVLYRRATHPTRQEKEDLAISSRIIDMKAINIWFQNKRQAVKKLLVSEAQKENVAPCTSSRRNPYHADKRSSRSSLSRVSSPFRNATIARKGNIADKQHSFACSSAVSAPTMPPISPSSIVPSPIRWIDTDAARIGSAHLFTTFSLSQTDLYTTTPLTRSQSGEVVQCDVRQTSAQTKARPEVSPELLYMHMASSPARSDASDMSTTSTAPAPPSDSPTHNRRAGPVTPLSHLADTRSLDWVCERGIKRRRLQNHSCEFVARARSEPDAPNRLFHSGTSLKRRPLQEQHEPKNNGLKDGLSLLCFTAECHRYLETREDDASSVLDGVTLLLALKHV